MAMREVLAAMESLEEPLADGRSVVELLRPWPLAEVAVIPVMGEAGSTEFVRIHIPGQDGKWTGGKAPTIGIIGRLGGVGARPAQTGLVSDADGAVAAIAAAMRIARLDALGDRLQGDVIVTTHICPNAPTRPHHPVEFMSSPISSAVANQHEISPEMDAVLSIDTTKGNRLLNHRGIAITPTVKQGWILRVSEDLLDVLESCSGEQAFTLPITMQDITPYGNGIHHLNSIMQPAIATGAPTVGIAITARSVVPGSATCASHEADIALAARYAVEVAKRFTASKLRFFDPAEFARLVELYGSMEVLQQHCRDAVMSS